MTEALARVARLHNITSAQERLGVGRSKVFALIRSGSCDRCRSALGG